MGNMVAVGKTGEVANGTMKEISISGREALLARVDDRYYVVSNRCPHMGSRLSRGKLRGTIVTCPRHGSQFDLRDGSVVRWLKGSGFLSLVGKALKSPSPLATYTVMVQGDTIFVEL